MRLSDLEESHPATVHAEDYLPEQKVHQFWPNEQSLYDLQSVHLWALPETSERDTSFRKKGSQRVT